MSTSTIILIICESGVVSAGTIIALDRIKAMKDKKNFNAKTVSDDKIYEAFEQKRCPIHDVEMHPTGRFENRYMEGEMPYYSHLDCGWAWAWIIKPELRSYIQQSYDLFHKRDIDNDHDFTDNPYM